MKKEIKLKYILRDFFMLENDFGINQHRLEEEYIEYKVMQPKGSVNDFFWSFLQQMVIDYAKSIKDIKILNRKLSDIYWIMARFRRDYEGVRANDLMQMSFDAYYESIDGVEGYLQKVNIISKCCDACDEVSSKKYTIEEIKKLKLASNICTNKWGCICSHAYLVERDKNGSIIRTDEEELDKRIEIQKKSLSYKIKKWFNLF